MAAGQVTQPVLAAGGAAAIPLTTVVYAATSLTFQRAALPRRSWRPCATWPSACSAEQDRSMPRLSGSTTATPTDPWRPSGSGSDETDITQERQSPGESRPTRPRRSSTRSIWPVTL